MIGKKNPKDPAGGIASCNSRENAEAIGEKIRETKEQLKKKGLTAKQINDHGDIAVLIQKLTSLWDQTFNTTALPLQHAYHDHNSNEATMRKFTRIDHNTNRFKRATNKGPCWCQCVGRRTTDVGTGKQYECRNTRTMPESEINGVIHKKGDIKTKLFWTPSKRWKLPYPCPDYGKTYNDTITCTPALPRAIQPTPARTLVEFCCGPASKLCTPTPYNDNCTLICLTEEDDVTTDRGLKKALKAVKGNNVQLWASMPCTGGSLYTIQNMKRGPKTRAKILEHRRLFKLIWQSFEKVAQACLAASPRNTVLI